MYKIHEKYTDFDGNEREEDFYFNLMKSEIMEMELGEVGGLSAMLRQIIATQDVPKIIEIFKKLVLQAYGTKSPDGKRFIKTKEQTEAFTQTEAYSQIFMRLATDSKAATEFVNHVVPSDVAKEAQKQIGTDGNVVPANFNN